jgi:hypothetical protein
MPCRRRWMPSGNGLPTSKPGRRSHNAGWNQEHDGRLALRCVTANRVLGFPIDRMKYGPRREAPDYPRGGGPLPHGTAGPVPLNFRGTPPEAGRSRRSAAPDRICGKPPCGG